MLTPGNTELGETSATRNFFIFGFVPVERASCIGGSGSQCKCGNVKPGDKELGKRVSFIFGDGQRNLATAAQRVSFIFGDCQRNLATACATRIFYLWRRPAQLGDGQSNLLNPGNTELGETSAPRNFLIFGFVPVERASFICGSGSQCKCGNVRPR